MNHDAVPLSLHLLLIFELHNNEIDSKHKSYGIRYYHGECIYQNPINAPHRHTSSQKTEHPQRKVFSVPGPVCLYDLRDQRDRGA